MSYNEYLENFGSGLLIQLSNTNWGYRNKLKRPNIHKSIT